MSDFWADHRQFDGLDKSFGAVDTLTISQATDGSVVGFEVAEFIGYSSLEIPAENIWDVIDYLTSIAGPRRAE